ncbi:MAG TPA: prenyltransferase/squalene oxidase repeat-containing protein [Candidatus Paceibacterota bacterium]|jgi:hypothetical protein
MRTKLLSLLLITSFLLGQAPLAFADAPAEVPVSTAPEAVADPEQEFEIPAPEAVIETPQEIPAPEAPSFESSATLPMGTTTIVAASATTTSASTTEDGAEEEVLAGEALASPVTAELATGTVSLVIRFGEKVAWDGDMAFTIGSTTTVMPTASATGYPVASDSLLGALMTLDAAIPSFEVSNLAYFNQYNSFLLNCITSTAFNEKCYEWQFVVNGKYSDFGMDQYVLKDKDVVYLYFGQPRRVVVEKSTVAAGTPFTATAQSYDPSTDSYHPLANYVIGITQPNPDNFYAPFEIATSTSGADGTASFTLTAPGVYEPRIKVLSPWGDYYENAGTSFTVASQASSGGTGGETSGFDIDAAYTFLASGQRANGSWQSELVTDWSALALAVPGAPAGLRSSLTSHLKENRTSLTSVLDYERHAMALMALGINPYTGGRTDYIQPIVQAFDGAQIGDRDIVNDDIFGLLVLLNAGYGKDDEVVRKTAAFIVAEQKTNGSWEGSADLTAAGIQTLLEVRSLPGVQDALTDAEGYLRSSQRADGGWNDPFATAWVLQATAALNDSPTAWAKGEHTPETYLEDAQQEDGGMTTTPTDYSTRAWATTYAIPAIEGLTWNDLLRDFKKPAGSSEGDEDEDDTSGNGTASSTVSASTTTPVVEIPAEVLIAETMELQVDPPMLDDAVTELASVAAPVSRTLPVPTVAVDAVSAAKDESVITATTSEAATTGPLTASVSDSGAWEWLKRMLASFWSFIAGIFS